MINGMVDNIQGVSNHRYALIPRTLIFLTRDDKILLLKGAASKKRWADRYNGIGGHIEKGEDILSAARRELLEETGISIDHLTLCVVIAIDTGQTPGVVVFVFRGECPQVEPGLTEEGILEWISLDEIFELPIVDDLPYLIPKVIAYTETDPVIFGQYHYDSEGSLHIAFTQ